MIASRDAVTSAFVRSNRVTLSRHAVEAKRRDAAPGLGRTPRLSSGAGSRVVTGCDAPGSGPRIPAGFLVSGHPETTCVLAGPGSHRVRSA